MSPTTRESQDAARTTLPGNTTKGHDFDLMQVEQHVKRICGRVLTVIEASFPNDSKQCNAVKGLVKSEFNRGLDSIREYVGAGDAERSTIV
jgi:hypothetical protein